MHSNSTGMRKIIIDVIKANPEGLNAERVVDDVLERRAFARNSITSTLCQMATMGTLKNDGRTKCATCCRMHTVYVLGRNEGDGHE